MLRSAACAWVFTLLTLGNVARSEVPPHPETNFPKGDFALTLEADYGHNFNLRYARFEAGRLGVGYYFADNMSLSLEAAGHAVQQSGPDAVLSELDIKLRHHLFCSGKFSFYMDVAGGVTYATSRIPADGTYYNYTIQTGPGMTWQLRDGLFFTAGARYWHLSNARLHGPLHNSSINAVEGYVGIMILF